MMNIQCNSCQKTFSVPADAITFKGRLVQCSSCGNKWTQYPDESKKIKKVSISELVVSNEKKETKINKKKPKIKKSIDKFSPEYLQKKYGLKIINPSSHGVNNKKKRSIKKINFGFYNSLITIIVLLITIFGILNLTQDIIIYHFPALENQIYYLYETLDNLKIIFSDIFSSK